MENQHQKITGYRDLSQEEIDSMNAIKEVANQVGQLTTDLGNTEGVDKRWLSIAITDLQKGFMALTRSIAKPTSF